MKTYIISNGRQYSDHEVLFVEVKPGQERAINLFLAFCLSNQGDIYGIPQSMGIVEGTISWREPNSSMSALRFIDHIAYCVTDPDAAYELDAIRRLAI